MPALVGHYTWLGFLLLNMPFGRAVVFLLSAQMLCGLFQAWIIGLGHNGMASYNAETRPDFWKLQVGKINNLERLFGAVGSITLCFRASQQGSRPLRQNTPQHRVRHRNTRSDASHTFSVNALSVSFTSMTGNDHTQNPLTSHPTVGVQQMFMSY